MKTNWNSEQEDWVPAAIFFVMIVAMALLGVYLVARPV